MDNSEHVSNKAYQILYIYIYIYIYTIVCINHVKRVLNTLVEQNIYIIIIAK